MGWLLGGVGWEQCWMYNQQPAPDLAQFLQLRALNQLSMPGYQACQEGCGYQMGMNMGWAWA
jgi:hypothetical protein